MDDIFWISRVPETLSDAQTIIEMISPQLMADINQEAHSTVCTNYADVQQRWGQLLSPGVSTRFDQCQ